MSHRRDLLHKNKLQDFKEWAIRQGYECLPKKGDFEVLRIRVNGALVLFHARSEPTQHVTTWGAGTKLVRQYLKERNLQVVNHD